MTHPDTGSKPLVLLDPAPQTVERIFAPETLDRLRASFEVVEPGDDLDRLLPEAFAIVGQPDLSTEQIQRATNLKALLNVEGNFYPNVDYAACFAAGVRVLGCGPAYAQAVAEYSLGLALDLARGISREDRAFRAGKERYLGAGNDDAILLQRSNVGMIGFGNLGRSLRSMLEPFKPQVKVYDPWLPDSVLVAADVHPAGLDEVLGSSEFIFVLATVTSDSEHLLNAERLGKIRPGARVIFVSRAAVTDYDALMAAVAEGRFLAAVDVWPQEPLAADHPARQLEGLVLSAHRAGGIPAAFTLIGEMVLDDLMLVAAGLPPQVMQVAAPELVGRYRNKPAAPS